MGIRFINNGKGGGSSKVSLNIFAQENEPTEKNGIWLKSNLQFNKVYEEQHIFESEQWNTSKMDRLPLMPISFSGKSSANIGNDIYLFGASDGTNSNLAYKYNALTGEYTQLKNLPYDSNFGSAVAIGTDIYLFRDVSSSNAYKYDTLTNEYTSLSNTPNFYVYPGHVVSVEQNIYFFGGGVYNTTAHKYNTLTNEYTILKEVPFRFYYGGVVTNEDDIYLIGSSSDSSSSDIYKYSLKDNTYTRLKTLNVYLSQANVISIGKNIYIFNNSKKCYRYNISDNNYTELTNAPYGFGYGALAIIYGDVTELYILGGSTSEQKIKVLLLKPKKFENNSIVIEQGNKYNTELINTEVVNGLKYSFYDIWHYTIENELNNSIPTYYGDGTEWKKFKN